MLPISRVRKSLKSSLNTRTFGRRARVAGRVAKRTLKRVRNRLLTSSAPSNASDVHTHAHEVNHALTYGLAGHALPRPRNDHPTSLSFGHHRPLRVRN